jgi:hypothetical protein
MSGARREHEAVPAAVRSCLALVSAARRQLARDELDGLGRLGPVLDQLCAELDASPAPFDGRLRADLLALLDEAQRLTSDLAAARARLGAELRAAAPRRRAGSAYLKASKL